jgi:hypothetical protein
MKKTFRPLLEALERREVPTVSAVLNGNILNVSGNPDGNVQVRYTGNNQAVVYDNGVQVGGTFGNAQSLSVVLDNNQGKWVDIDLGGHIAKKDVAIDVGAGDSHTSYANYAVCVHSGIIGGNLTLSGGVGQEVFAPGLVISGSGQDPVPASSPLTVKGNLTFNPNAGSNLAVSNNDFDTGFLWGDQAPTVTVNGTLTVSNAAAVGIGQHTTVANLTYSAAPAQGNGILGIAGTVRGNVQATFGNGAPGNTLDLTPTGKIGGNLQAGMGNGPAIVLLEVGSTIKTNAIISSGSGNDSITVDATVFGDLNVTLGDGNDTVTIGSAPGGLVSWASGNGNDSVTFGDATNRPGTWNVYMLFHPGNDTITLAGNGTVATPNSLTGFISMGGPPGGNSFDPTGSLAAGTWQIVQPFKYQNV